jgi:glutamine synthetase
MSGNSARLKAITAINKYKPPKPDLNFFETPTGELFNINVFDKAEMKRRLPKRVYKSLTQTMDRGVHLDTSTADIVAAAMKDWAIEKGRHALRPRFLPSYRD